MKPFLPMLLLSVLLAGAACCWTPAPAEDASQTFNGNVSWYGAQFDGKKTASGEIFNMNKVSAAHRTLPLPTRVLVENPKNGKSAIVKVNDRGPYNYSRVMDISRQGAIQLDYLSHGTAYVECTVLPTPPKPRTHN